MSERDKKKRRSASAKVPRPLRGRDGGPEGLATSADRVFAHVRVDGLGASVEAREHGCKRAGGKLLPNPRSDSVEARSRSAKASDFAKATSDQTADRPVVLLDESGQRVASASPAAQRCGVRAGASLWETQRRCPEVLVAEADSEKYEYFWQQVVEVCGDYTPRLQEVTSKGDCEDGAKILRFAQNDRRGAQGDRKRGQSDNAGHAISLDLTGTERLFGPAKGIAQEIRNRLRVEVGVAACIGIGPNRMVARLACESARLATRPAGKPGEVVEVKLEEAAEFVGRLPISALPGVDEDWAERLSEMGIRRAKDLAALPAEAVGRALGEWGRRLWEIARGGDPLEKNEIGTSPERYWEKGIFSVQFDLRPATEERGRVRAALRAVTEEVGRRLRQRGQAARQVKITLVFRDMRKVGARRTLRQPAQSGEWLFQAAGALFERMKLNGRLVRRVRVTVAHLAVGPNGGQLGLPLLEREERRERLAERVDQVKDRYGEAAVARGSTVELAGR